MLQSKLGRNISTSVGFHGLRDAFQSGDNKVKAAEADTRYFVEYDFKFSGRQPKRIFFKCSQSFKENWPLGISTVIPVPPQTTINRKKSLTVEVPFKATTFVRKP